MIAESSNVHFQRCFHSIFFFFFFWLKNFYRQCIFFYSNYDKRPFTRDCLS